MYDRPSQVVQGLVDGVEVLHELTVNNKPVLGRRLAEKLGLHPVRANRLLMTLQWLGIAHRDKSRRYSPGPGMHILAAQSLMASGLLSQGVESLTPLMKHDAVVALGVLWRDKVTFLYHHNPGDPPLTGLRQWVISATKSSVGMALLAEKSDEELLELYDDRDDIPGPYPTIDALMDEIEEIRVRGSAVLRHPAHTSMGVPVGKPAFAAVAISGPISRDEEPFYSDQLFAVAREIESKKIATASDVESYDYHEVLHVV